MVLLGLALTLPAVAEDVEPTAGPALQTGSEGGRLEFTQLFRRGLKSLEVDGSWTQQQREPAGARSDLYGPGLQLTALRFKSMRSATGVELGFASLTGKPASTDLWSASWLYRGYFTVKPRWAGYWQGGVGASYLSGITPEQSSHTNFYLHAAAGAQWPAGDRGAWQAQCRVFHVSSGGTTKHNQGINATELRVGRSFYF